MGMFRAFCVSAAFILASASFSVLAGDQTGKITSLIVRDSDGLVYVTLDGTPTNKPACASHDYWMVKNENSESGKRQYAALMAAMMADKAVRVGGLNTCTRWSDGEDINFILIKSN